MKPTNSNKPITPIVDIPIENSSKPKQINNTISNLLSTHKSNNFQLLSNEDLPKSNDYNNLFKASQNAESNSNLFDNI